MQVSNITVISFLLASFPTVLFGWIDDFLKLDFLTDRICYYMALWQLLKVVLKS